MASARPKVAAAVVAVCPAEPCSRRPKAAAVEAVVVELGLVCPLRLVAFVGRAGLGAAVCSAAEEGVEADDRVGGRLTRAAGVRAVACVRDGHHVVGVVGDHVGRAEAA